MSASLFSLLILVLIANTALSGLLPRIQNDYVQLEPTDDNKYSHTLRLIHPEGAMREELVEEISPGQLQINGVFKQDFDDPGPGNSQLVVTYTADTNGYVAKYSYVQQKQEPIIVGLPPSVLKSVTG